MRNSSYLPSSVLKTEFEEFRKLKTTEEKDTFQKKIKMEFNKKTPAEQQAYLEASEMGLKAIGDRVEELIDKHIKQNTSFKVASVL
jgi:tRNA(Ser,Leu) C12 N-acetylase TAN1